MPIFYFEKKTMTFLSAAKFIASGLCTVSLIGAGMGIGVIFGALIIAFGSNPEKEKQMFTYALLGFALTEAIALFGLMMAFFTCIVHNPTPTKFQDQRKISKFVKNHHQVLSLR